MIYGDLKHLRSMAQFKSSKYGIIGGTIIWGLFSQISTRGSFTYHIQMSNLKYFYLKFGQIIQIRNMTVQYMATIIKIPIIERLGNI